MTLEAQKLLLSNTEFWTQTGIQKVNILQELFQAQTYIADSLFKTVCKHRHLFEDKIKNFKQTFLELKSESAQSLAQVHRQLQKRQKSKVNIFTNTATKIQVQSQAEIRSKSQVKIVQKYKTGTTWTAHNFIGKLIMFRQKNNPQIKRILRNVYKYGDQGLKKRYIFSNLKVPQLFLHSIYKKQIWDRQREMILKKINSIIDEKLLSNEDQQFVRNFIRINNQTRQSIKQIYNLLIINLPQNYLNSYYSTHKKEFLMKLNPSACFRFQYNKSFFNSNFQTIQDLSQEKKHETYKLNVQDWICTDVIYSCGFCRKQYIKQPSSSVTGLFLNFMQYVEHIILEHETISEENSHIFIGLNQHIDYCYICKLKAFQSFNKIEQIHQSLRADLLHNIKMNNQGKVKRIRRISIHNITIEQTKQK